MSYTLARLPVPRALWDLVADKLRAAGYDVIRGGTIDMTHIGLEVAPDARPLTPMMDNVLASRLGAACQAAAAETKIGDSIDRGLVLLRELRARGFDLIAGVAPPLTPAAAALDVVFDGPPGHEAGRFVEVENMDGRSVNAGRWIDRGDGTWALRIGEPPAPGSCGRPAAVEIRPLGDVSPDNYTHSCRAHAGDMLGVREGEPEPPAYEVRELAAEEIADPPGLVCCYITPPYAPEPDGVLTTGAPAIGSAP